MPLSKILFDMGVSPQIELTMRQAYQFLAENQDLAYSKEEIVESLGSEKELGPALNALERLHAVSRRKIGETDYFILFQEFDTGTWLSKKHLMNQAT